jgi:parallel beta-helix repeat protein
MDLVSTHIYKFDTKYCDNGTVTCPGDCGWNNISEALVLKATETNPRRPAIADYWAKWCTDSLVWDAIQVSEMEQEKMNNIGPTGPSRPNLNTTYATPANWEWGPEEPPVVPPEDVWCTVSSSGQVKNAAGDVIYNGSSGMNGLNHAMDICPASGTIGLLAGTFNCGEIFYIFKNIKGSGWPGGTIIKTTSGLTASDSFTRLRTRGGGGAVSNITVSDIEFDGSNASATKMYGGIDMNGTSYCTLKNLWIHHMPRRDAVEMRGAHHNILDGIHFNNIGSTSQSGQYGNGICSGDVYNGICSHHNTIKNCVGKDCSMVGYNMEPGRDNVFDNCSYECTSGYNPWWMNGSTKIYSRAVTVYRWSSGSRNGADGLSDRNVFRNCNFKNKGIVIANYGNYTELDTCTIETTSSSGEGYAPTIAATGDENYGILGADYFTIKNCTIKFIGSQGIHLYQADNCTITNNDITKVGATGGTGISNGGKNNTISGTVCHNVSVCVG